LSFDHICCWQFVIWWLNYNLDKMLCDDIYCRHIVIGSYTIHLLTRCHLVIYSCGHMVIILTLLMHRHLVIYACWYVAIWWHTLLTHCHLVTCTCLHNVIVVGQWHLLIGCHLITYFVYTSPLVKQCLLAVYSHLIRYPILSTCCDLITYFVYTLSFD